jgi:hypothetical protein
MAGSAFWIWECAREVAVQGRLQVRHNNRLVHRVRANAARMPGLEKCIPADADPHIA